MAHTLFIVIQTFQKEHRDLNELDYLLNKKLKLFRAILKK
jgi:hypothetical protein